MAIVIDCGTALIDVAAGADSASSNPAVHVQALRPDDQILLTSHVANSDPSPTGRGLFCAFVERIDLSARTFTIFIHAFKGNGSTVRIRVDWAVLRKAG